MNKALLLVAYQCGPNMGSVSQIGWEWYQRMAQRRPVTLITHSRNRAALEQAGAPFPGSQIEYIDTEWLAGPLYRTAQRLLPGREHAIFLLSSLDFFLFDSLALRRARQLRAQGSNWGLVHIPTPVSSAAATRLHRLGLPLVRGPLNCGLGNPDGFESVLAEESLWLNCARQLGQCISSWFGRSSPRHITLTATAATRSALPAQERIHSRPLLENGIDLDLFAPQPYPALPSQTQPLQVLFVGRMLPVKGVNFLLHAMAQARQIDAIPIKLTLVGDGAKRQEWMQLAVQLGIETHCHFVGNLPLQDIPAQMAQCHVFCLPSIRESGGAVLLEAMASGRGVIAFNFGGPAELVSPQTGFLIDAQSPESLITQLRQTLADVYWHPRSWAERGRMAASHVRQSHTMGYCWDDKIDQAETLYATLLQA